MCPSARCPRPWSTTPWWQDGCCVVYVADWIVGEIGMSPEPLVASPLPIALGANALERGALSGLVKESQELLQRIPL